MIVESATYTQDTHGERDPTWATYCTRWMSMRTIKASERLRNDIDLADQIAVFTCRSDPITDAITPQMRLSVRSRTWNIETAVNVDEGDRMIEITARTIQ